MPILERENTYMDKYSNSYKTATNEDYPLLCKAMDGLRHFILNGDYSFCRLPNGDTGIKCQVKVNAGTNSCSGLLLAEPIIIGLKDGDINCIKPYVFPDRTNFPYDNFPHINPAINNMPKTLCLTRESMEDWYAEKTFEDMFHLIQDWFNDAENDNLIKAKDGDKYETFTPQNVSGFLRISPYLEFHLHEADHSGTIFFDVQTVPLNDQKPEDDPHFGAIGFISSNFTKNALGMMLFRDNKTIERRWFSNYPHNVGELLRFIKSKGFIVEDKLKGIISEHPNITSLYFLFSFLRPIQVVGKATNVDFLCFATKREDFFNENLDAKIDEIALYDQLTPKFANFLSGTKDSICSKRILLLGCGAIGSKLAYHFVRDGLTEITICDNDIILPHNLCRHALTNARIFESKVNAVKKDLSTVYELENIKTINKDILEWLPNEDLTKYDLIIDATASVSVLRLLDSKAENYSIPIVHFALSDAGEVGLAYIRRSHSARLSDYYWEIVRQSLNSYADAEDLKDWIKQEQKFNYELIRVGEGCHSNTMILSDDTISTHTGIASNIIRNMFERGGSKNEIYLSFTNKEYIGQVFTQRIEMPDYIGIHCENSDWIVRIPTPLLNRIYTDVRKAGNKETGGYLMGCVEEKHKVIYVLYTFIPEGSSKKRTNLTLSKTGWKQKCESVVEKSSNTLSYIGDWHSHPKGSLLMSERDNQTNAEIIRNEISSKFGICIIANKANVAAYILTDK